MFQLIFHNRYKLIAALHPFFPPRQLPQHHFHHHPSIMASANFNTATLRLNTVHSSKSLIFWYFVNSWGPGIDSCNIALITVCPSGNSHYSDSFLSIKFSVHVNILFRMSYILIFHINILWEKLS